VAPRGGEVAPLDELPRRSPQQTARTLVAGAPAEDAAHRLPGIRQLLLEPAVEGAVEEALGHVPRRHREERVDARLDRPLAEQSAQNEWIVPMRASSSWRSASSSASAMRARRASSIAFRSRSFQLAGPRHR